MSRGQFQTNGQSGKVLRGCKNKGSVSKVPIIDVDDEGRVEFVTFDAAESSHKSSTWFRKSKCKGKTPIGNFINIDDEESNCGNEEEGSDSDTMSRTSFPSSSSSYIFDGNDDDDECVIFVKERKTAQEDPLKKENIGACSRRTPDSDRACENGMPVRESFDLSSSESDTSDDDEVGTVVFESESSDCEIIDDSSGNVREEWQRAASKKRMQEGMQNASDSHANASESGSASGNEFYDTFQQVNVQDDACKPYCNGNQFVDKSFQFNPNADNDQSPSYKTDESRGDPYLWQKEFCSAFSEYYHASPYQAMDELNFGTTLSEGADMWGQELKQSFVSSGATELDRMNMSREKESIESRDIQKKSPEMSKSDPLASGSRCGNNHMNSGGEDCDSHKEKILIGDREKHKESEEYKRAAEEEWAARQEQLRIQAEEVRRLRKKKKAESLRLLDMERRQKQRLAEVRESQKKNEETLNLKEQLRMEVRKQLDLMELQYRDMASLLCALGIQVGGGRFPLPQEVHAAYKQALLRFHPDRASRTDIRQQVEAEEKFKLISRLKEKLLP